jgi:beta-N-acetylhexosaminidase
MKNLSKKTVIVSILAIIAFFVVFLPFSDSDEDTVTVDKVPEVSKNYLGMNMLLGVSGYAMTDEEKRILSEIQPAGIILYSRNYQDDIQFKSLVGEIKGVVGKDAIIILEDGPGLDISNGIFKESSLDEKALDGSIDRLSFLGVSTSPIISGDFPLGEGYFSKQGLPLIGLDEVEDFNSSSVSMFYDHGMLSVIGHYPGLGMFYSDPYMPGAQMDEEGVSKSLSLFKGAMDSGVSVIITSHAYYPQIDSESPAVFSPVIIKGLLEDEMGFKGLVITDDLSEMGLEGEEEISRAMRRALEAGHHIVIYSGPMSDAEKAYDHLSFLAKEDIGLQDIIETNYEKVILFNSNQ